MFFTRFLCGVPKWKTPKPKKWTHKFHSFYRLVPTLNLARCKACGGVHEMATICLNCYENVRVETVALKTQMVAYNPYLGERQPLWPFKNEISSSTSASSSHRNDNDDGIRRAVAEGGQSSQSTETQR